MKLIWKLWNNVILEKYGAHYGVNLKPQKTKVIENVHLSPLLY